MLLYVMFFQPFMESKDAQLICSLHVECNLSLLGYIISFEDIVSNVFDKHEEGNYLEIIKD